MTVTNEALAAKIDSLDEKVDLIWGAHEREHGQHELAHSREHKFAQDAIDKAAELAKENKADANEWRATMNDREVKFATKEDIKSLGSKIDHLENSEIRRAENERLRLISEGEEKRQTERRQSRQQWQIGIAVGLFTFFSAIVVNLVIRLATT